MILVKPYNRERAVNYAETWALRRNPLFLNFAGRGGDCTNFTSQCLLAGSCTMDFTPDFGWYYISSEDRAPAWTSVAFFYDFITEQPVFANENAGIGPFGREVRAREIEVGDFIQLADEEGDYYHTLIITGFEPNDILVCAHTDDALNRRLSTYNFASLRFIHIDGVRIDVEDDVCYEPLLEGRAIEVNSPNTPVEVLPAPTPNPAPIPTPDSSIDVL
ncbi:MAG: amidase domain-containing protein [Clostridia bacterium]|nr:amidase domain-containing protein [Clostridia bacterium]